MRYPTGLSCLALLVTLAGVAFSKPSHAADGFLTLATTTSTESTGLLAYLHPDFERSSGVRVKVIAKGTGASLQLGRDGNADLLLVHAREAEDKFIQDGYGVMRRDVMYNDFVLVGPPADPARIRGLADPARALRRIAEQRQLFISRGDNSGTHLREQDLWRRTSHPLETVASTAVVEGDEMKFEYQRPAGDWYLSIGQGMGKTLTLANERQAYTLADRGTYLTLALAVPRRIDLDVLSEGHASLFNPYGIIAVNPQRHPHVNFVAAQSYIAWITSPETQRKIGEFRVQGQRLFHPHASPPPQ